MERIYIVSAIYTSENSDLKENNVKFHPQVAGTKDKIYEYLSKECKKGSSVELTSKDVHMGSYFEKVMKITFENPKWIRILGVHSVWEV